MGAIKKAAVIVACVAVGAVVAGCSDADTASHNVTRAADNFEVQRRIVFFNGITDKYLLTIEGACALGNHDTDKQLSVTCKTGDGYKKLFLGLSDNVSYFVDQPYGKRVSKDHYRVVFKPSVIIPDIDVRKTSDGVDN